MGKSAGGKNINLYKFGSGRELIIITAGLRGDDPSAVEAANELIELLSSGEIKLKEDKSIWIAPNLNPDSFENGSRLNANGAAPERNFPVDGWTASFYYKSRLLSAGQAPFSEPESVAIKKMIESIERKSFVPIVINLLEGSGTVLPGDSSQQSSNLYRLVSELSGCKMRWTAPHELRAMTGWISSSTGIAAVDYEAAQADDRGNSRLKGLLLNLINCSINKKIYHKSMLSYLINTDNSEDHVDIVEGLPIEVRARVTASAESRAEFTSLFEALKGQEELLLLVNKSNYLESSYTPTDLFYIKEDFATNKEYGQLREILKKDLKLMYKDAAESKIRLVIISAYRSYDVQKVVFAKWKKVLGEKEAVRVSAAPGSSQHQLGTAIDFNMLDSSFEKSKEGRWLLANSYKYGFALSYPKGMEHMTGYKYEPWHYRYIGREAALLVYKYFDNNLELFLNWYWQ